MAPKSLITIGRVPLAIRIVIADDHTVVRQGLRMFLSDDPDFEIVGEAPNGAEALKLAHELKPDVVLMDLLMPVMDGITAIGRIRKELPDIEGDRSAFGILGWALEPGDAVFFNMLTLHCAGGVDGAERRTFSPLTSG